MRRSEEESPVASIELAALARWRDAALFLSGIELEEPGTARRAGVGSEWSASALSQDQLDMRRRRTLSGKAWTHSGRLPGMDLALESTD